MGAATTASGCTLEQLNIKNTFVDELPGDSNTKNTTRQVTGALWSPVQPTPTGTEPTTVAFSTDVCQLLGLDPAECERPEFPLIFSGSAPLPNGKPYAQCYGGHQFGNWAGQLGDGRAISIGEVAAPSGALWELQLKGAGKTPYSRFADGRAVLRSSLREFVASEAMHILGVPTTRALSLVATGDKVARDMFYNGDVKAEPGAVVCRVSETFIRFGTFQLPVSRGDKALTTKVADHVIKHFYPHLAGQSDRYIKMLEEVVERTARLVAKWQLIGFVHGVLNTDNMSITGATIDYGPYGFLDKFDPVWTPNLTDAQGRRYCYKAQPEVVQWNLAQLATALLMADLVTQEQAQAAVDAYAHAFLEHYNAGMAAKLGLLAPNEDLANELLTLMYKSKADFTNCFRALSHLPLGEPFAAVPDALAATLEDSSQSEEWLVWLGKWGAAVAAEGGSDEDRRRRQRGVNPCYIPRQHLLQYAIDAAERGDYGELETLMQVLRSPFEEQPGREKYAQPPPPEMVRPGICMLSCSS